MKKDGYESHEETIELKENTKQVIRTELKRVTGILTIKSKPEGALVLIDKLPVGRTPLNLQKELGEYRIDLQLDGYQSQEKDVSHSFQSTEINETLTQKPGKLTIITEPLNAEIVLNGENFGKSPILSRSVLGGMHTIKVGMEGFHTQERMIEVSSLRETTVLIKLMNSVERSEAEKAGFAKLQLKRFLSRAKNQKQETDILKNGCDRGMIAFCFDLYDVLELNKGSEIIEASQIVISEKINQMLDVWSRYCQLTLKDERCSKLLSNSVLISKTATLTPERQRQFSAIIERQNATVREEAKKLFPAIKRTYTALLSSCLKNKKTISKSDLLCQFVVNLNEENLFSGIEQACADPTSAAACVEFSETYQNELKTISKDFDTFKMSENNKNRLNLISMNSCKNFGYFDFTSDYSFPQICSDSKEHPGNLDYLFEMCTERKNSGACLRYLSKLEDYFTEVGNIPYDRRSEAQLVLKARCEFGETYTSCENSRFSEKLEILFNLQSFFNERACNLGSFEACEKAGRESEAFEHSAESCIRTSAERKAQKIPNVLDSACIYAFNLHLKPQLQSSLFSRDGLLEAMCYGGVAEACLRNGELEGKNYLAVKINCGLLKTKKVSLLDSVYDLYWKSDSERAGYCKKNSMAIGSGNRESSFLKNKLIRTGCVEYKDIEMCQLLGDPKSKKSAITFHCSKGSLELRQCSQMFNSFSVPERSDSCFNKKIAGACRSLGDHFGRINSKKSAKRAYSESCSLKDGWSCGMAGLLFKEEKNIAEANRLFRLSCDMKYYHFCVNLGLSLYNLGLEGDAFQIYSAACSEGEWGDACKFAGFSSPDEETRRQFFSKARDIYTAECNSGRNDSCLDLQRLFQSLRKIGYDPL